MKLLLAASFATLFASTNAQCTDDVGDWVQDPSSGHLYRHRNCALSWVNANTTADSITVCGIQAHLATITSLEEQSFINGYLGGLSAGPPHIGLYQPDGSLGAAVGWEWVNGEGPLDDYTYSNWAANRPADLGRGPQDCAQLITGTGQWTDISCTGSPQRPHLEELDFDGASAGNIVINGCDTGVTSLVSIDLTTCNTFPVEQSIENCFGDGACIEDLLEHLVQNGIISDPQKEEILYCAADHWYLDRVGNVTARFSENDGAEVLLHYEAYQNRTINVTLYDYDCETALSPGDVLTYLLTENTDANVSAFHLSSYDVELTLDTTTLYTSNVWDVTPGTGSNYTGELNFCIRLDLLEDDVSDPAVSVSFTETQVSVLVTLAESNFTISDMTLASVEDDKADTEADTSYEVIACQCDATNKCYDDPPELEMNSVLRVCVSTVADEVKVAEVYTLIMFQGNTTGNWTEAVSIPISNGVMNPRLTNVAYVDDLAVVGTRLLSQLFDNTTEAITVMGTVFLEFKAPPDDRRSLRASRKLQGEDAGTAEFEVTLKIADPEEESKSQTAAIAGGVAGGVVGLLALLVLFVGLRRRKTEKSAGAAAIVKDNSDTSEGEDSSSQGQSSEGADA